MSSIVNPESRSRFQSSLFNATAENNFEGIVKIYASHSRETIASRFAVHECYNEAVDSFRMTEEKRDESRLYFPSADSSYIGSSHTFEFPKGSYVSRTSCDLASIIENSERGLAELTVTTNLCAASQISSPSIISSTSMQTQASGRHDSVPFMPEVLKPLRQNTSEPQRRSRQISNPMQQKGQKRHKNLRQAKIRGGSEVECCLYETSMSLSNSRPHPSFVVCRKVLGRDGDLKMEVKNTVIDNQDYRDQDCTNGESAIFDGAVANSTPIGTGSRRGSGGGTGTILHLACAIDSPFALAVLLVMGANVSSYHTTYRRSIFHEAACSDSPKCLRLLLKIGERYYESTNTRQMKTTEKPGEEWKDTIGLSHVSTLQIISQLIVKMRSNELSDFDAAQSLLSEIPLTKKSSAFIAASCGIQNFAQDTMTINPGTSRLNVDADSGVSFNNLKKYPMYDGHGNSPLHWAAFKNAAACVDLLLSYHADPNTVAGNSGWTPLHDAAYSDSADSMKLLIAAGADVNAKANSGATPLCFAAQEDAAHAIRLLLHAGADARARCCEHDNTSSNQHPSRFSGYTPLHYCAHYNAYHAARALLEMETKKEKSTKLLEIPDLNEKLSIHIAVCRASSAVLKELLHGGARLDTDEDSTLSIFSMHSSPHHQEVDDLEEVVESSFAEHQSSATQNRDALVSFNSDPAVVTPISSPVLQSMIPPEPITSSKPWNCITQRSIDECNILLRDAELNWTPERHAIFHPRDRLAVLELLRVGKRLEQMNTGIFLELWPLVLSFCGRGWFEPESSYAKLENNKSSLNELMDFSLLDE